MDKKRKIRCDCGGYLEESMAKFDGFQTRAMVCKKCGFTTLTKEQALDYAKLRRLHEIVDAERKIIRIGNSMGLTFPDRIQDFGVKVGKRVRVEALTSKSFKIELI